MKTKIAIACQGGGSQTAFTAGVLKALSESHLQDDFEFVSISGTSGGALCATLVWYSLRKGEQPVWKRLIDFWHDNTAQNFSEEMFNSVMIEWMRLVNSGFLPVYQTSPASPLIQAMGQFASSGHRAEFSNFPALLRRHIDFDEIAAWGPQSKPPVLIIGAASVLTGRLRKFNSSQEAIRMEHILASAAVPNIFPAVPVGDDALWDGLFSDNPPLDDLVRKGVVGDGNIPNEIWIIKINPTARQSVPVMANEIADRRNQLEGNVSMFQNLKWIEMINDLILLGAFKPEFLEQFDVSQPVRIPKAFASEPDKAYHIPWIEMSAEMQQSLDYEGKLDRSRKNVDALLAHGEERGRAFLAERAQRLGS
ncbi:MAG: patatin-like phospholipase family protein [Hyphomicrobiales bacterium]|nr:patatin-like phospholipase family protein [Alphaproteobacteria bacterium]